MKKVLVIEDQPDMLRLIQMTLSRSGYAIHMARDGVEGLKKALTVNPDLILLDVMLPDLDGWEVRRRANLRSLSRQARHTASGWA